jgi:antitoxin ParD1/3/4
MPNAQKRTFSLPVEHDSFIDAKVASGDYASEAKSCAPAVARCKKGCRAERWLKEQAAPVYDAMRADPSPTIPAESRPSRETSRNKNCWGAVRRLR